MSDFDYLSLIKRQAKALSKEKSIKLNAALALVASNGGFNHYHHLQKVASKDPDDIRLMRLALQTDDLKEVIYGEGLYDQIDHMLEDELSASIAETNAYGFSTDQMTVNEVTYDQSTGILTISTDIIYAGEQDSERPYSGTTFYLEAVIRLFRLVDRWVISDSEDALQIVGFESDQDRDWKQQQNDEDIFNSTALTNANKVYDLFSDQRKLAKVIDHATRLTGAIPDIAKQTGAIDGLKKQTEVIGAFEKQTRRVSDFVKHTESVASIVEKTGAISGLAKQNGAISEIEKLTNRASDFVKITESISSIVERTGDISVTNTIDRLRKLGQI